MSALTAPPAPVQQQPSEREGRTFGLRNDVLSGALSHCRQLLAPRDPFAFALDLGDIDLPPVVGGTAQEQAQLRELAPLYLAAELESTRLLSAVEMLAGLFASGVLMGELGAAARRLHAFHLRRRERLTVEEREALFGRLFGKGYGPGYGAPGGRNHEFEPLMVELAEALSTFHRSQYLDSYGPADEVRLHTAATNLAANLVPRSGGVTAFAARDALATIQEALDILKEPALQAVLGGRSVWSTVREVARRYLGQTTDIVSHVTRGRAGVTLLAWLADALPVLGTTSARIVTPDHPAVGAALAWMQATLTLEENRSPGTRPVRL